MLILDWFEEACNPLAYCEKVCYELFGLFQIELTRTVSEYRLFSLVNYLVNSNSHLNLEFEIGKIKFIAVTYQIPLLLKSKFVSEFF